MARGCAMVEYLTVKAADRWLLRPLSAHTRCDRPFESACAVPVSSAFKALNGATFHGSQLQINYMCAPACRRKPCFADSRDHPCAPCIRSASER